MTLQQFIDKYNGKKVCNGGLCQCVALYRQYVDDVLRIPQSPLVQEAWQIFNTASNVYYDKILNTPAGYPQANDIIIWKEAYGGSGHIAIVVDANRQGILSFDQNYTGHGDLCQLVNHSYNLILGWLHPKGGQPNGGQMKINNPEVKVEPNEVHWLRIADSATYNSLKSEVFTGNLNEWWCKKSYWKHPKKDTIYNSFGNWQTFAAEGKMDLVKIIDEPVSISESKYKQL